MGIAEWDPNTNFCYAKFLYGSVGSGWKKGSISVLNTQTWEQHSSSGSSLCSLRPSRDHRPMLKRTKNWPPRPSIPKMVKSGVLHPPQVRCAVVHLCVLHRDKMFMKKNDIFCPFFVHTHTHTPTGTETAVSLRGQANRKVAFIRPPALRAQSDSRAGQWRGGSGLLVWAGCGVIGRAQPNWLTFPAPFSLLSLLFTLRLSLSYTLSNLNFFQKKRYFQIST